MISITFTAVDVCVSLLLLLLAALWLAAALLFRHSTASFAASVLGALFSLGFAVTAAQFFNGGALNTVSGPVFLFATGLLCTFSAYICQWAVVQIGSKVQKEERMRAAIPAVTPIS